MKFLVVDDNEADLKLMSSVLSQAGHEVLQANSGERAVQLATEDLPEVIVTDISLSGITGLAMIHQLKKNPRTAEIPVIAITSYPESFTKKISIEAGCKAYFIKPINTRTITQQIIAAVNSI